MQRFNCTNLPVQEKNEEDYRKAITRMKALGIRVEACWPGDIIAYQEQEIKRYRVEVEQLREIIEDTERDTNVQIEGRAGELAAERIVHDTGATYLKPGDTVILKCDREYCGRDMDRLKESFRKAGINTVILHAGMDIAGVIGHGA